MYFAALKMLLYNNSVRLITELFLRLVWWFMQNCGCEINSRRVKGSCSSGQMALLKDLATGTWRKREQMFGDGIRFFGTTSRWFMHWLRLPVAVKENSQQTQTLNSAWTSVSFLIAPSLADVFSFILQFLFCVHWQSWDDCSNVAICTNPLLLLSLSLSCLFGEVCSFSIPV